MTTQATTTRDEMRSHFIGLGFLDHYPLSGDGSTELLRHRNGTLVKIKPLRGTFDLTVLDGLTTSSILDARYPNTNIPTMLIQLESQFS